MLVDGFFCCALLHCCTIVHTWWVMDRFVVGGWCYYYCCTATIAVVVHGRLMGRVRYLGCRCSISGVRCEPSPYSYQLRAVALTTTRGYLHNMVLPRAHCCCYELRAAGRAYPYLLLVEKSKGHITTYLYCDTPCCNGQSNTLFSLAIQASGNNIFI